MKNLLLLVTLLFVLAGLSCQKEVTTSPEEVLIPKYLLYIDSKPQGSKIFLDGRYMGQRTPDTIKWLEEGNHLITLKAPYLKDSSVVVNITGEYDSIFLDYTTNPTMFGNLYVESRPDSAQIYINDSSTGLITPVMIKKIFPSEYKLTFKLPGYWDASEKVIVVSERTVSINAVLPDSTQWVNFTAGNIGLPSNEYNDIDIQDGYIKWLAGEGSGLLRFVSATDFTVYNTGNSSIPSNYVKSVRAADNGVWIGTGKGVAFFNNGNFTVYNSSNSIVPDSIDCVSPAPGGKVWVGSVHQGVFYFDGNSWTKYNSQNSPIRIDKIGSIFFDQNGLVWIGTLGEGLFTFDGTSWVKTFNALPSPRVDAIQIKDSEIYVGTTFHTRMFWNGLTFKEVYYPGGLGVKAGTWAKYTQFGNNIVAVSKDNSGNLWFSDFNTGLYKKAAEGFKKYYGYVGINGIAIDASGHKWMSTSERGIVKYKGN